MMSASEKHVSLGVRVVAKHERNLRRLADRKGYKLTKSRSRFPAPDCGMYAVIDAGQRRGRQPAPGRIVGA